MSRLGDTIRAARVKAGMTPKALGKKCGVAESFINDVERGTKIVSDDQAQRILKVLGVKNPISTELEVAADNERAAALYQSEGFAEYGRNPKGFRSRRCGWQEVVLMRRELV